MSQGVGRMFCLPKTAWPSDLISRQRDLGREVLIDAIEKALLQAARKRYGTHRQISVSIDRNTGEVGS